MAAREVNEVFFRAGAGGLVDFFASVAIPGWYLPQDATTPAMVNGGTYHYRAESNSMLQFESGIGTWNSGTSTLERTLIFQSSSGGAKVNFTLAPRVRLVLLAQDVQEFDTVQIGAVELGHASDTTLTRVSAGVAAIEGQNILTAATGQPLDSDLSAIALLTTTAFGRSLLELADDDALAALVDSFFLTPAEGNFLYQPVDTDLSDLAAIVGVQGDIIYRNASAWVRLPAGTSGQFLKTLGAGGNPLWDTVAASASPGGSDTFVQYNDLSAFGGDAGFTYNETTNIATLAGGLNLGAGAPISWNSAAAEIVESSGAILFKDSGVENARIDSAGRIIIGGTSPLFLGGPTRLSVEADIIADSWLFRASAYGNDFGGNVFVWSKTRGANAATHVALQDFDALFLGLVYGSDGTTYRNVGALAFSVRGTVGTNDVPTEFSISNRAQGATSSQARVSISPDGLTSIQNNSALTSGVFRPLQVQHTTSGVPANDIGVGLQFLQETSAGNNEIGAAIDAVATDVTAASEDFALIFSTMAAGAAAAERVRITSVGRVLINYPTVVVTSGLSPRLQIAANSPGGDMFLQCLVYEDDIGGAVIHVNKTRGANPAAHTIVQDEDDLFEIQCRGSDGTGYIRSMAILGTVDGAPGTNDMPGRWTFHTTPNGGSAALERLRINSAGNINIGGCNEAVQNWPEFFGSQMRFNVVGTTFETAAAVVARFSANAQGPGLFMAKSRGALGVQTAVVNNDVLWDVQGYGSDGTEFIFSASITARVNGTVSTGVMPSDIEITTTRADGSALNVAKFSTDGLKVGVESAMTGALTLAHASSAFLTTLQAGNALAARTYVWPTDFGSAGDVLTDMAGDGVLSWEAGGGGGYTDEQAQDAVGTILANSATINLTYVDGAPSITADLVVPVPVASGGTGQTTAAEAVGELIQALADDNAPNFDDDYLATYKTSTDTGMKLNLISIIKRKLLANTTIYVRADGSDANAGFDDTAGGAKLTLQSAFNLARTINANGFRLIVQVRAGTFAGANLAEPLFDIAGPNATWPGYLELYGEDGVGSTIFNSLITINALVYFDNFAFTQNIRLTHASGAIGYDGSGLIVSGNTSGRRFDCIAGHMALFGNISITSTGTGGQSLVRCLGGAAELFGTWTWSSTPSYTIAIFHCSGNTSTIFPGGVSYVGSPTGKKFHIDAQGSIDTFSNDLSLLPGSLPGTIGGGGFYR